MSSRNSGRFLKKPIRMAAVVITMVAGILAVTVFSARVESLRKEKVVLADEQGMRPGESGVYVGVSPASEEEVIISEDGNRTLMDKSEGRYLNDRRLSVQTGYGMIFYLGQEQSGFNDALYLNPHFEYEYAGNPNEAYGYLIKTERVPLEYSELIASPAWSREHNGLMDFLIHGRTYDKVVSASAIDSQNYGVRWIDRPAYGGLENDGDRLYILIIRLSDGTLMGAIKADISYDTALGAYHFENLINNDVSWTGELTSPQRDQLIQNAIQYLISGNERLTLGISREELESLYPSTVVERTQRTYHSRLYNAEGNVVSSGRFSNCDIYAVNLNCDGYGFFTVYFAPEPQAHGLTARILEGDGEMKLTLIGYDAFAPFTVETFNSFIHPEDIEMFAAADE